MKSVEGGQLFMQNVVENISKMMKQAESPCFVIETIYENEFESDSHTSFVISWDIKHTEWLIQSVPHQRSTRPPSRMVYKTNMNNSIETFRFRSLKKVVTLLEKALQTEIIISLDGHVAYELVL